MAIKILFICIGGIILSLALFLVVIDILLFYEYCNTNKLSEQKKRQLKFCVKKMCKMSSNWNSWYQVIALPWPFLNVILEKSNTFLREDWVNLWRYICFHKKTKDELNTLMKAFDIKSEIETKFVQKKLFDFLESYDDNNELHVATLSLIKLTGSLSDFDTKPTKVKIIKRTVNKPEILSKKRIKYRSIKGESFQ